MCKEQLCNLIGPGSRQTMPGRTMDDYWYAQFLPFAQSCNVYFAVNTFQPDDHEPVPYGGKCDYWMLSQICDWSDPNVNYTAISDGDVPQEEEWHKTAGNLER